MSNRPMKNKKKVVVEEQLEPEVEYRPPGRTGRDVVVQVGVTMLIIAFILAPMLGLFFSDSTDAAQQQAQQQQQQADDDEQQIKRYSEELAKDPNNAVTLANLGYYTTMKAGKLQMMGQDETQAKTLMAQAEGYLRKSLEKDPSYGFAQSELAKNLLLQDKHEEAKEFIEQGLKDADAGLKSEDTKVATEAKARKAELLNMAAFMDFKAGSVDGAIAKMDEVIALTPGNAELYQRRASYYMEKGDKDSAKKDLATMVDIGQKTGNQQAAMIGQMMLEQIDKPPVTVTPGVSGSPAPAASGAPAATQPTPIPAANVPLATPAPASKAPAAPATPR